MREALKGDEQKGGHSRSTKRQEVHFATLMDICRLKNVEFVLRGDIAKDDSGSFAVSTEQGSSASQMTTAKVLDCAGQAADAASAHTQAKMEVVPKL